MADGIYRYTTKDGEQRWYVKYRDSTGKSSTKRGFTSPRAAAKARAKLVQDAGDGAFVINVVTFGDLFDRWLAERRPYLEAGSYHDYRRHGEQRFTSLRAVRLTQLTTQRLRAWIAELVATERWAPKTINNALTALVSCLNYAKAEKLITTSPAGAVDRLPEAHIERDYLRLDEIRQYLESCSDAYRPLAEILIATGMRISEALALVWRDVDFDNGAIRVLRSRKAGGGNGSTKGDRYRSVDIGQRTIAILRELQLDQAGVGRGRPEHAVFSGLGRWESTAAADKLDRNTVSRSWHKNALRDAGLRDMPLHSLRHTAAATWLTTGQPLMYVQRQLGHRSITTTERCYGHLEGSFLKQAAAQTESAIWGSVETTKNVAVAA
jgi:integrase